MDRGGDGSSGFGERMQSRMRDPSLFGLDGPHADETDGHGK